jgi:hypothetical protein
MKLEDILDDKETINFLLNHIRRTRKFNDPFSTEQGIINQILSCKVRKPTIYYLHATENNGAILQTITVEIKPEIDLTWTK